eukprot:scaffold12646_cov115-Isochrysis_galbana.AAC.7
MLLPIRGRPLGRRAVRLPLRLHDTLRLNNRGRWLARAGARRPVGHRGLLVGAVDDEGDHDGDIVGPAPAPHDVVVLGEQREGRVDALVEGELLSTLGDAVGQHLLREVGVREGGVREVGVREVGRWDGLAAERVRDAGGGGWGGECRHCSQPPFTPPEAFEICARKR